MPFEVGMLCGGKVTKITAFGAFVALDEGKSGMIHISEISSGFVKDIHDFLTEGQEVRLKVIKIDENGRISLSLKQAAPTEEERLRMPPAEYVSPARQNTSAQTSDSFEDMMSRFKAASDDRISDLRQAASNKRSNRGYGSKRRDRD
ncbi:MAG: S1 RNA-binding domain-containing protein [Clostridia bacterium]|nr:S1 RNA-binding domain-containing protein [Clostridia bacterium]